MGTQRAERGYHPGLFTMRAGDTPFSSHNLLTYWWTSLWITGQGRLPKNEGGPLEYKKEDWKLKVPLEYLT